MKLRVGLAQIDTALGNTEKNLEKHLAWIEKAREQRVELLVFPELSLTGYMLQDLALAVAIQPSAEHPLFHTLLQASAEMDLVVGFVEVDQRSQYYISTAYLSRNDILHIHRKLYLPTYSIFDEKRFFSPGNAIRAFDTRFGRMGLLVCEDFWHLSPPYLLWLDGADLFLCVAASPAYGLSTRPVLDSVQQVETAMCTYAGLLTSFILYTNRVGFEDGLHFPGGAMLISPTGNIQARAPLGEETLLVGEVDLDELRSIRFRLPLLRDERPELVLRELQRILGRIGADLS